MFAKIGDLTSSIISSEKNLPLTSTSFEVEIYVTSKKDTQVARYHKNLISDNSFFIILNINRQSPHFRVLIMRGLTVKDCLFEFLNF